MVLDRYADTIEVDQPLAMVSGGSTNYYETDGLESTTSLTSTGGALAQQYTDDSFGKQTAISGSITNPFQYTGRDFDSETELVYLRSRYYDPSTGRFLSVDSKTFDGGINFYAYVANDPLNETDPFGLLGHYKCTLFGGCYKVPMPQQHPPSPDNPIPDPNSTQINIEFNAFMACTGPDPYHNVNISGCSIPSQNVTKPSDNGPQGPPPQLGNLENDIAMSTLKKCLQLHPLAAFHPHFPLNWILPGNAF